MSEHLPVNFSEVDTDPVGLTWLVIDPRCGKITGSMRLLLVRLSKSMIVSEFIKSIWFSSSNFISEKKFIVPI